MNNLYEKIKDGDKEAINSLYKEYSQDVYNLAFSVTGEHESALDATKNAFVDAFKEIREARAPENFRLFIMKLVYDEACKKAIFIPDDIIVLEEGEDNGKEEEETKDKLPVKVKVEFSAPESYASKTEFSLELDMPKDKEKEKSKKVAVKTKDENVLPKHSSNELLEKIREEVCLPQKNDESIDLDVQKKNDEFLSDIEKICNELNSNEINGNEISSNEIKTNEISNNEINNDEINSNELPINAEIVSLDDDENKKAPKLPDALDILSQEEDIAKEKEIEKEKIKKSSGVLFVILLIFVILLTIALVWLGIGILISADILPLDFDLGYSWFNENFFSLF